MKTLKILALLFALFPFMASGQSRNTSYLYLFTDTQNDQYGYLNDKGDTIIKSGKYSICFTDTFKTNAIVLYPQHGFVAIDRNENILYEIFPFDNGPDPVSEGLYRIIVNKKMGFADQNGQIIIQPRFGCAYPFEKGKAKVSESCKTIRDGEHSLWISDSWYFIDKKGNKLK